MTSPRAPEPTVQAVEPGRQKRPRRKPWRRRRDWGGIVARTLCVIFAVVGLVPLAAGGLARLDSVQRWAAVRTTQLLRDELGVEARYQLDLRPWPLSISLEDLEIAASDGGSPFLSARRVVARPRIFSLLAGKLDLGEVAIEEPVVRAVVRDGKLTNLHYELPETEDEPKVDQDLPLSAISLTDARVDLTIDDVHLISSEIDVDISAEQGPFEVSVRTGRTEINHRHADPAFPDEELLDEDVICALELRAGFDDGALRIRRLQLHGALDLDPEAGSRPGCDLGDDDWRKLALEVTGLEARYTKEGGLERVDGRVKARVPVPVLHRFVDFAPTSGWVEIDLDEAHYDRSARLPRTKGTLLGKRLGLDSRIVARSISAQIETKNDQIHVTEAAVGWAGGEVSIARAVVSPFTQQADLDVHGIVLRGVSLQDLLDDLSGHPRAHVGWELDEVTVERFGGTLNPLDLSGPMVADTRNFAVYDRPTDEPNRFRMMGVQSARVSGLFKVTPDAIVLSGFTVVTPRSRLRTTVSLGYEEILGLTIFEGSEVELADISPVVDVPMTGKARISLEGHGAFNDPLVEGDLSVDNFVFGGFPIGDLTSSRYRFRPLALHLTDAKLTHGTSHIDVPELNIDFDDGDADVVLTGRADTRASGLHMVDFFDMVKMGKDPRWKGFRGLARGIADIDFVLGGRRDRFGGGRLHVTTDMALENAQLFGERYDSGSMQMEYLWDDIPAGDRGIVMRLHSGVLRKGKGTLIARAAIDRGAKLQVDVTGTAIPLTEISAMQNVFGDPDDDQDEAQRKIRPEAKLSFVATVGGTLDRIDGQASIDVSPLRIGPDILPASHFTLDIVPTVGPTRPVGRHDVMPDVNRAVYDSDPLEGVFRLRGSLFAGQVKFDDFEITQQTASMASGKVELRSLDLGALANLLPDVAFSATPPRGSLTADVFLDELPLDEPGLAEARMFIQDLRVSRAGTSLRIQDVAEPVLLSGDALRFPSMPLSARFSSGLKATLVTGGTISHLSSDAPKLDLELRLDPVDLSKLGVDIPQIKRAAGEVRSSLTLEGTFQRPRLTGRLTLEDGLLRIEGFPLPLDDINLDVRIREGEIRVRRARARAGNTGLLSFNARLPMRGFDITGATGTLVAQNVSLPVADGVKMTANATLNGSYEAPTDPDGRSLPHITGAVSLTQFAYTRPMSFSIDIDQLTGRGRTVVDAYKPENDLLTFDIRLSSPRPLRISNNLIDMRLGVTEGGIRVSGTDQRFGARGSLRIEQDSKLFLQGHDFVVRDGTVTFDDPTRIAPRLDVHATTEYRRYAASSDASASSADATSSSTGGQWRISMHAHGDTDEPKVRFTSDPPLSQDDIVLLLQVGMTRAELDRGLAGSLAQTVGIEALSAVTGLGQAVRKTVPVIDEFRVGSQYSSRSGRPEPTVSVGKRISDKVRAGVTTGLSETREVRANLEWKLSRSVSVQGSYDNVNDVSSSVLGNVGADLRWRLEFE
ncbi:MAG: translocation/assembly module TamB domain-containing protein [Deltaproteobacteria bacterium]|nr:translocation/assembly module TamB domain-containing protein [Deltaproteobacteria bacterium]